MKRCSQIFLAAVCCLAFAGFAGSAFAAAVPGVYQSTFFGGPLLEGRSSQSWTAPANGAQGLGDVFNAQSWNGSSLGTQWAISCGTQNAPQLVQDNRVSGTGTVVFTNSFLGGTFYFNNGPWCSSASCTGTINQTIESVTVQYASGIPYAAVVNINTSGMFDGGSCNLTFAIANGVGGGDTDAAPKPATYPAFLDTSCNPTRVYGSWGDVITITAKIDCPTPARTSSWGAVKSMYR